MLSILFFTRGGRVLGRGMSGFRLVHVVRDGKEMGRYFLSFVELCLRNDDVGEGDWGWVEGMDEWTALPVLADEMRVIAGTKKLTTAKQKKLLIERGFVPWRGMAREEAEAILAAVENGKEIATDHWKKVPKAKTTLAQKAHLEFLGVKEFPDAREEAQCLISNLDSGEGGLDYDATDEILRGRIPEFQQRIRLLKRWMKKSAGTLQAEDARYDLEELEEGLDGIQMTLKDRKQERLEEARFDREDRREYIAGLQWEMGPEGHWRDHIRKPTINQVKECLDELEKENPEWEDELGTPLYQKLIWKFPALQK